MHVLMVHIPPDTQFAPEHHFTTITHSQMSHTVLPANVDDDQLVGYGPVDSLPLTQYTVRFSITGVFGMC